MRLQAVVIHQRRRSTFRGRATKARGRRLSKHRKIRVSLRTRPPQAGFERDGTLLLSEWARAQAPETLLPAAPPPLPYLNGFRTAARLPSNTDVVHGPRSLA